MRQWIFIPLNNVPLPLTEDIERQIMAKILTEVDKSHGKEKSFEAEVLLYISEPAYSMISTLLKQKYQWVKAVHISIDPEFEQSALDNIAQRMTGGQDLKHVSCFRIIPRGLLDKKQTSALKDSLLKRFGEAFIVDIPEVSVSPDDE